MEGGRLTAAGMEAERMPVGGMDADQLDADQSPYFNKHSDPAHT